ncbi:MAG: phosphotransferase [Nocardioides sp.]
MREPPSDVRDEDVLAEVRRTWDADVDRVSYLPVGFGAHHWAAYAGEVARLFVTFDERRSPELDAAYAGAGALRDAGGLEFVLAPLPLAEGGTTVPFGAGDLSCSTWYDGTSGEPLDVAWTTEALRRLHAVPPPPGLPLWQPKVGPDFAMRTRLLVERDWGPGPYAAEAREAVGAGLGDVARWTDRYHHLAGVARGRAWVPCHGEPHADNQLLTASGRFLVDWDTLRLAPAELDLRILVDAGVPPAEAGADPDLLELFDVEWRLDEISQYAAWFAAPHTGTEDDVIAIADLHHELTRDEPSW